MPTLLHLDASARHSHSVSRQVSAEFAQVWRTTYPEGTYLYRDLAAEPVPHVDESQVEIMTRLEAAGVRDLEVARAAAETAEEKGSWGLTWRLVDELLAADTVVIGMPMYNFSAPSSFKAWFDRVAIPPVVVDFETGIGPLAGKQTVVVTARGGAYGPGTPRNAWDFQEPYLRAAFGMVALADDLTFVHAEMTKSGHVARLAQFRDLAASSFEQALAGARKAALR